MKGLIFAALFYLGIVALSIGFQQLVKWNACRSKITAMEKPYKWGMFSGCFVQAKSGDWVPLERYRVVE